MRIGITYDLKDDYVSLGLSPEAAAEFDSHETIDAIDSTLKFLGHKTDRIGTAQRLVARIASGDRWDMVFNIAEGVSGFGRESQVPAILDVYGIPYTFSDVLVLALTLHKGMTKHVVRDLGIPTPDFKVITEEADVGSIHLPYPIFLKPVAEGTSKGVTSKSKIERPEELEGAIRELLQTFKQPVLAETYLPGREFTIAITGTGSHAIALGALEVLLTTEANHTYYSYENKEMWRRNVGYRLASDPEARLAMDTALAAWRALGCRDGGRVDMRSDFNGIPNFIEVNPLAGLNPNHSDMPILARLNGIDYATLIHLIMDSACRRMNLEWR